MVALELAEGLIVNEHPRRWRQCITLRRREARKEKGAVRALNVEGHARRWSSAAIDSNPIASD